MMMMIIIRVILTPIIIRLIRITIRISRGSRSSRSNKMTMDDDKQTCIDDLVVMALNTRD